MSSEFSSGRSLLYHLRQLLRYELPCRHFFFLFTVLVTVMNHDCWLEVFRVNDFKVLEFLIDCLSFHVRIIRGSLSLVAEKPRTG